MIALALALTVAAQAAPDDAGTTGRVGLTAGVIAGQLGAAVSGGGAHRAGPWLADGEAGIALRLPTPELVIDRTPSSVAGLGTALAGLQPALGPHARLGPVAIVDVAVLGGWERDCEMGSGCRHWWWVGSEGDGAGLSVAPAGGVRWDWQGDGGAAVDLSLAVQPTFLYDIAIPWEPRVDFACRSPGGVMFGARAWRYGAGLELGLGPKG